MIDINVNDYVRVRLNDLGRKHHRDDFLRWTAGLAKKPEYRPPQEDADGWSRWQLWSLMQLFGPTIISLGAQMPFDSCIQVGPPPKDEWIDITTLSHDCKTEYNPARNEYRRVTKEGRPA